MFIINRLIGFGGSSGGGDDGSFFGNIQAAGLTSGLICCLDAGSSASYPGSGQTWSDLSGNGYDFLLGADNSATATDPTFNGSAGALSSSEYFSLDGGDYFTLDESANPSVIDALHKDNALVSWLAAVYAPSAWGANDALFGTGDMAGTNNVGMSALCATGAGKMGFRAANGSGSCLSTYPDSALGTSQWLIIGGSINEPVGSGGGFYVVNGAYNQVSAANTFTATYSSPSASSAAQKLQLCAGGNGTNVIASGARIACFALWNAALSKANMDTLDALIGPRFGV